MLSEQAQLALNLKGKCVEFVMRRLRDDFDASPAGESLDTQQKERLVVENEYVRLIDWFLLFGKTTDGVRVLDVIQEEAKLNPCK